MCPTSSPSGGWFDRLSEDMTTRPRQAPRRRRGVHRLDRQVGYRLGAMMRRNKLALADFAASPRTCWARVLDELITVGIDAGSAACSRRLRGDLQPRDGHRDQGPAWREDQRRCTQAAAQWRSRLVGFPRRAALPRRRHRRPAAGRGAGGRDGGRASGTGRPGRRRRGVNIQIVDQRSGGAAVETRERRGRERRAPSSRCIDEVDRASPAGITSPGADRPVRPARCAWEPLDVREEVVLCRPARRRRSIR